MAIHHPGRAHGSLARPQAQALIDPAPSAGGQALHDMGDPPGALRRARAPLASHGTVLLADERVAEEFTAPSDQIERFRYASSVLHCLPATMAESPVGGAARYHGGPCAPLPFTISTDA